MDKIPTAEEIFKTAFNINHCHIDYDKAGLDTIKQAMIKFAKLQVEAALKAASENADLIETDGDVDKSTILNAYPLENIK